MVEPDAALMRRWRDGDRDAATGIVRKYTPAVGAVAYGILGDAVLCEDAVQETFARAARDPARLPQNGRAGPYLMGIARHVALDMLRQRARETALGSSERASPADTAASNAERAELRTKLHEAVAALPRDQRDVFLMKYTSGMRYAEIADATGLTPEAVGQKLWRIRQKLQKALEDFRP